jgi:3-oxoacyl-[acyl-carrier protein] reductase
LIQKTIDQMGVIMDSESNILSGRVAIVTGAGRGLGRAMALGLAQAGARVLATASREKTELDSLAAEVLQSCGPDRLLPFVADVTREEDCLKAVETALQHFGGLQILVNNAGRGMKYVSPSFLTQPTRFWEVNPATWRMVIDTNVNGPFLMARNAVPAMLQGGWGRVINISMNFETMKRRGFSPYGPSKAALESETTIWAQELSGTGVTVNALLPGGATLTGMIPERIPEGLKSSLLVPAIMVPPLLWLASTESDGITGRRFVAKRWRTDLKPQEAAMGAMEDAGWPPPNA